jgi:hypothetical protein
VGGGPLRFTFDVKQKPRLGYLDSTPTPTVLVEQREGLKRHFDIDLPEQTSPKSADMTLIYSDPIAIGFSEVPDGSDESFERFVADILLFRPLPDSNIFLVIYSYRKCIPLEILLGICCG